MPKAILEFNLPEETKEFRMAENGDNYFLAITDILNRFRALFKYTELTEQERLIYTKIQEEIYGILEDYEVKYHF